MQENTTPASPDLPFSWQAPWGKIFQSQNLKLDSIELEYVVAGIEPAKSRMALPEVSDDQSPFFLSGQSAVMKTDPKLKDRLRTLDPTTAEGGTSESELLVGKDVPAVEQLRVRLSAQGRTVLTAQVCLRFC